MKGFSISRLSYYEAKERPNRKEVIK
jgi:hypothetical protein